jgi:hypothetical protein
MTFEEIKIWARKMTEKEGHDSEDAAKALIGALRLAQCAQDERSSCQAQAVYGKYFAHVCLAEKKAKVYRLCVAADIVVD